MQFVFLYIVGLCQCWEEMSINTSPKETRPPFSMRQSTNKILHSGLHATWKSNTDKLPLLTDLLAVFNVYGETYVWSTQD